MKKFLESLFIKEKKSKQQCLTFMGKARERKIHDMVIENYSIRVKGKYCQRYIAN